MFEIFDSNTNPTSLVNAIITNNSGVTVLNDSISFVGGEEQTSFYDASLEELGIDAGILLTSGTGNPPTENTSDSFSAIQLGNTDEDLQIVADNAFAGSGLVQDANILEFSFVVDDPDIKSISVDIVFGSEEFPEFSNSNFVDVGAVFVNGQNVGLFNNEMSQPLSVIDENLSFGNFIDNTDNTLSIEYDGISSVLSIIAPVQQGTNTIKFGVADTGDRFYDSGLFIANLSGSEIQTGGDGSGVLISIPGTDLADEFEGSELNELFEGFDGDDSINAGDGNDVIDGGAGEDFLQGGAGQDTINGGMDSDTIEGGLGMDILSGSEANDFFCGTLEELDGDTILDFAENDLIVVKNASFTEENLTVIEGSAILNIDIDLNGETDSTVILEGDFSDFNFIVETESSENANLVNTIISIQESNTVPPEDNEDTLNLLAEENLTIDISAEVNATFTNIGGFYQSIDTEGTVIDPVSGEEVAVGEAGYEAAAIANSVIELGDDETATLDLEGGSVYVPYLLANGTRFFTAFAEANVDGLDHIQSMGENTFAFEDLKGGGDNDFNDFILSFEVS